MTNSAEPDGARPGELAVSMVYLAIATRTLEEHAPGGASAFLAAHPHARSNADLAVWCAMGADDLEPVMDALQTHGVPESDVYLSVFDGLELVDTPDLERETAKCDWLRGRIGGGRLWLSIISGP
jgi:hypothetical protein